MHNLNSASLGAVLKTALDAVVVMRLDGTIAGWNDVAEQTFGWSYAEAYGHRMSEMIIPLRYREAHETGLAHYLSTGEGPVLDKHLEIEALHRAGHELPVELSITRTEQFGEPVFLGFLRDISDRRDAARRQDLLIGELNHRVKNLLGVVSAIAQQTARSAADMPQFTEAFQGRLVSLSRAHEILTTASWDAAPFQELARELLGAYTSDNDARVTLDGHDVLLLPRHLLSLCMILHELLTNAVKYGALSRAEGDVAVTWTVADGEFSLIWNESGISGVQTPTRNGFGSRMIEMSVSHELHGSLTKSWNEGGLRLHLRFPMQTHT